ALMDIAETLTSYGLATGEQRDSMRRLLEATNAGLKELDRQHLRATIHATTNEEMIERSHVDPDKARAAAESFGFNNDNKITHAELDRRIKPLQVQAGKFVRDFAVTLERV